MFAVSFAMRMKKKMHLQQNLCAFGLMRCITQGVENKLQCTPVSLPCAPVPYGPHRYTVYARCTLFHVRVMAPSVSSVLKQISQPLHLCCQICFAPHTFAIHRRCKEGAYHSPHDVAFTFFYTPQVIEDSAPKVQRRTRGVLQPLHLCTFAPKVHRALGVSGYRGMKW